MALLLGDSLLKRLLNCFPHEYHTLSSCFCLSGEGVQIIKSMVKTFHHELVASNTDVVILLIDINDIIKSYDLSIVWSLYCHWLITY